jgi:hypothetical protein
MTTSTMSATLLQQPNAMGGTEQQGYPQPGLPGEAILEEPATVGEARKHSSSSCYEKASPRRAAPAPTPPAPTPHHRAAETDDDDDDADFVSPAPQRRRRCAAEPVECIDLADSE